MASEKKLKELDEIDKKKVNFMKNITENKEKNDIC